MQIKIKRLHPTAVIPSYAHVGDSGFDLCAIEDVIVRPGQTVKVRTGLAFSIPDGYELQIRPRSGISAKTKLRVSNSPATIDASFRGEVMVLVDNIHFLTYYIDRWDDRDLRVSIDTTNSAYNIKGEWETLHERHPEGSYIIHAGDRIAQGIITPVIRADIVEVDELDDTERGAGGFGSTGVR